MFGNAVKRHRWRTEVVVILIGITNSSSSSSSRSWSLMRVIMWHSCFFHQQYHLVFEWFKGPANIFEFLVIDIMNHILIKLTSSIHLINFVFIIMWFFRKDYFDLSRWPKHDERIWSEQNIWSVCTQEAFTKKYSSAHFGTQVFFFSKKILFLFANSRRYYMIKWNEIITSELFDYIRVRIEFKNRLPTNVSF